MLTQPPAATPAALPVATCPVCGAVVVRTAKVGRPRDYCSDTCRETAKLIGRLSGHLDALRARELSADGERLLRRRLWSLVNATLNKRRPRAVSRPSTVDGGDCGSLASK